MSGLYESRLLKRVLPFAWVALAAGVGWILFDRLQAIDFPDILHHLEALPSGIMFAALACSTGVYTAVGLYEGLAVRLATGREMFAHAFRTAVIANPIGRAIGFAVVSSGALRYRMYAPAGLTIRQVGAVIALIVMPFVFGVGWLIDLSLLFHRRDASVALQLPAAIVTVLAVLGLGKDIGWLLFVSTRKEPITIRGQTIRLPPLRHALVQIAFGLTQISLMSATLYLLMPPELDLSWPAFVATYCIAFVAGQLSNVPAGLGVLEAALLLMLPQVPPAKLVGSVLAYRAVYEVLPMMVALAWLLIYESTHPAGVIRRKILQR